jgi:hypothetical protein
LWDIWGGYHVIDPSVLSVNSSVTQQDHMGQTRKLRRVSCFWLFRLVCLFICHKLLSVAQQDHMGHTTKLKRVSCFWPFPLVCLFICHKLFSVAQQDHMGHNKVKEGIMFLTLLSVLLTVTTLCYLTREREHSFL